MPGLKPFITYWVKDTLPGMKFKALWDVALHPFLLLPATTPKSARPLLSQILNTWVSWIRYVGSMSPLLCSSLLLLFLAFLDSWNGLPRWLSGKESTCNTGDTEDIGLIPGSGRSPEEGMETQFSILAWEMPWTEEPGELQSKGSQRVGHSWATKHSIAHNADNSWEPTV